MNFWLASVGAAWGLFFLIVLDEGFVKRLFPLALFLPLIDFVVETLGQVGFELWAAKEAYLMVGGAPALLLIALFPVGYLWLYFLPDERDETVLYLLITGILGAFYEKALMGMGYLEYLKWWNSFSAFALYVVAFVAFLYISRMVIRGS